MGEFGPKFAWKCPRLGCKKEIVAWTQGGLDALKQPHEAEHAKDDRLALDEYIRKVDNKLPADYSILRITGFDTMFLLTRGIAIDSEMEYDNGKATV